MIRIFLLAVGLGSVWCISSGQVIQSEYGYHEHALAVLGPDTFAVAQSRTVEIRSWTNPARPIRTLPAAPGIICSLASTQDGKLLAAGDLDANITVWEVATGKVVWTKYAHKFTVWTLAFSPDGTLLASGSFDATVRLWDTRTWIEVGVFIDPKLVDPEYKDRAHVGWVRCITFSPDGKTLATSGCDGFIRIWNVDTLRLRRDPIQAGINVYSLSFSPDGRYLACSNNPGEIRIYRTDTWELVRVFREGLRGSMYAVTFSPDGRLVASGGYGKRLEIYDVGTGQKVTEFRGHEDDIWGVAFLPDGKRLITTSRDLSIRLWRLGS